MLKNFFLILSSVLIFFFGLEIFLRFAGEDWRPSPQRVYVYNQLVGFFHRARVDTMLQTKDEVTYRFRTNALGLRGPEYGYAKPPGIRRVLMLGDSFILGDGLDDDETIPAVLEKTLNSDGKNIEVINMAVSGFGTWQEALLLEHEGVLYHPDVVVLGFYLGNDFRNNHPELSKYYVDEFRSEERAAGGPVTHWRSPFYAPSYLQHIWRRSQIRSWIVGEEKKPDTIFGGPIDDGIPFDYKIYLKPTDAVWLEAAVKTETELVRIRDWCVQRNLPFLVLIIPPPEMIYEDWWQEVVATRPAMQEKNFDLDFPRRELKSILNRHDIEFLDLTEAFLHEPTDPRLYYKVNTHLNPQGARLVAQKLRERPALH